MSKEVAGKFHSKNTVSMKISISEKCSRMIFAQSH